jgi:hypothetical protein
MDEKEEKTARRKSSGVVDEKMESKGPEIVTTQESDGSLVIVKVPRECATQRPDGVYEV